jgi:uncharacterized protein (DUF433 family)
MTAAVDNVDSFFGVGFYSVSEAARILTAALLTKVSKINLRRWRHGRKSAIRDYTSVIQAQDLRIADKDTIKFLELVELLTVASMCSENVKMRDVRDAYVHARQEYGNYPFASKKWSVYGGELFIKASAAHDGLVAMASLNRAFESIVKPLLHDIIVYEGDSPLEITPLGKDRSVVLDPERSFGSPINRETGVPTYAIYGMYKSGEEAKKIAQWYHVSELGVEDAIEYETRLAKAA